MDMAKFAQSTVHADTGYPAVVVQMIWDKYSGPDASFRGQLPPAPTQSDELCRAGHLYVLLIYIHKHHSPQDAHYYRLPAYPEIKISKDSIYRKVLPLGRALVGIIDEVDFNRRLDPFNHPAVSAFKYHYTTLWDTFPIYVPEPSDFALAALLYQPKYGVREVRLRCSVRHLEQRP